MKRETVALPNYVIGADAYEKAADILKQYGKTAVVIGGKRATAAGGDILENARTFDCVQRRQRG